MKQFKKRNTSNFWYSPLFLVVLFLIFIVFVYNVVGLIEKERETNKKKELILEQINSLQVREESLSSDIKKLDTKDGQEDLIREKFQVAKEGEKVVVIVDDKESVKIQNSDISRHNFWSWFKKFFVDK